MPIISRSKDVSERLLAPSHSGLIVLKKLAGTTVPVEGEKYSFRLYADGS